MLQINRIKKRFLIKLMRMLGFGGMAAYCMASCTTSNSQSNTNQSEVQANANQSEMMDSTTAQPDNHQDNSNPPTEIKTVESAENNADPTEKKLSDDELDKLLEQYHYKKLDNYSTRVEKHEGMASVFTNIVAKSDSGKEFTFPDNFKAIVQGSNGAYYAVFSDGTIDSIPSDFFYGIERCTAKYACPPQIYPDFYYYHERDRGPIGPVLSSDKYANPNGKKLSDDELDKLLEQYHYKKMKNYSTRITKKDDMASFIFIEAESKTGNKITFPDTFKAIVQGSNGDYYAVFSDGTIDSIPNNFIYDSKHCNNEHGCHRPILVPFSYVYQDRNRRPIGQ